MARILVIDDSQLLRVILKEILIEDGNECYGAATESQGFDIFQQKAPDLVIKDLVMENSDPLGLIKQFKEIDPEVKIIICSTLTQKNLACQAIKAGAQDFLLKPFKPEEVTKTVRRVLAN